VCRCESPAGWCLPMWAAEVDRVRLLLRSAWAGRGGLDVDLLDGPARRIFLALGLRGGLRL
jgi:hypothetical protein